MKLNKGKYHTESFELKSKYHKGELIIHKNRPNICIHAGIGMEWYKVIDCHRTIGRITYTVKNGKKTFPLFE